MDILDGEVCREEEEESQRDEEAEGKVVDISFFADWKDVFAAAIQNEGVEACSAASAPNASNEGRTRNSGTGQSSVARKPLVVTIIHTLVNLELMGLQCSHQTSQN